MWCGGLRYSLPVAAPFVWRCLNSHTITPFPHPPHQTGHLVAVFTFNETLHDYLTPWRWHAYNEACVFTGLFDCQPAFRVVFAQ
jgi:hypothetical protein